ncbi:hypothetical protein HK405_002732, partial [Cladochytrium tenue]
GFLVYSGDPVYLSSGRSTNNCASSSYVSTAPGCYDAALSGIRTAFRYIVAVTVVGSVLILVSIGAAVHSRATFLNRYFKGRDVAAASAAPVVPPGHAAYVPLGSQPSPNVVVLKA